MKMQLALWLYLLLKAGISQAAPAEPVSFQYNDVQLTTHQDEFGPLTTDPLGRVAVQDGGVWYYASLSSAFQADLEPVLVKAVEVSVAGIAPELAAYSDPVIDRKVRASNAYATDIVPVLGDIPFTFIFVEFGWGGPRIENFWSMPNGQPINKRRWYDSVYMEGFREAYPDSLAINEGGYELAGSANDWWLWQSQGRSSLVPDTSRYPAGYDDGGFPGFIMDPATGEPFYFEFEFDASEDVWATFAAAGIDVQFDPLSPIALISRGGAVWPHAHYSGWLSSDLIFGDAPLMPGTMVHEGLHVVGQLKDLYGVRPGNNRWQLFSYGGLGFHENGLNHKGFPSGLGPSSLEMLGWLEPTYITHEGEYAFDQDGLLVYAVVNPADTKEKFFFWTWSPDSVGFMARHRPSTEGRVLIEHTSRIVEENYEHAFLDDLVPELISIANSGGNTWPNGGIHGPELDTWENGDHFPWDLDLSHGTSEDQARSFQAIARPATTHCVVMNQSTLTEEVPLGGAETHFSFLNLGQTLNSWEITIADETVSSTDIVNFNETFEASFSSNIWGAGTWGQILDIPVSLQLQDTTITIERLRPFVGLRPSNWSIPGGSDVIVESYERYSASAEGTLVTFYLNEQMRNSLSFATEVQGMCFSGLSDHLAVVGDNWVAICQVQDNNLLLLPGWPVYYDKVDDYCVADLSEYGLTLVVTDGDQLEGLSLENATSSFSTALPDYIESVSGLAYAGHDPAGDLGSRFCLLGDGGLSDWAYVTNIAGDSLFAMSTEEGASLHNPLSMDVIGTGQYAFVLTSKGPTQEMWVISYSQDQAHYGICVFDLGGQGVASYESGIEALVPFHNTDVPSRAAIITNDHYPYHSLMTDIKLMDYGHNTPEVRILQSVDPRRRGFYDGNFNADVINDLLVWDRGDALSLWRGQGDLVFVDQGKIHSYESANHWPKFVRNVDDLQIGFYEDSQYRFYDLGYELEWPVWARQKGDGNRRWFPNDSWSPPSGPLNPPDLQITSLRNGDMLLTIESVSVGQRTSTFQVWFSTNQEDWEMLDEVLWDGQSNTTWLHSRALYGNNKGFYRVKVTSLDGGDIWNR